MGHVGAPIPIGLTAILVPIRLAPAGSSGHRDMGSPDPSGVGWLDASDGGLIRNRAHSDELLPDDRVNVS